MIRRFLDSYGELVLVFGLGLLAQAELWIDAEWAADRYELAPVALAMTAVLLLRIRAPLATLVLEVVGMQVMAAVNTAENNDPMAMVTFAIVAIYSAGAHTRGRALLAATLLVLATTTVVVVEDGSSLNVSGFLFFGFLIGGPFLAGVVIRIRRERERLLVRERDERARTAVAEERTRIARELHDVVAHAISVIVLQARGAKHSLADDPDDARRAVDAIERTASQALGEMRRLLAILRADDDAAALAPEASLTHLDVLAGEVRAAGLPVEIRIAGEPRELSPGLDASAYRIVQEALTNALKHAGRAHAVVSIDYDGDVLDIEVADDGVGATNGDGGGHGLLGMRERAAVFGGRIEAGPRTGGGYAVRARLPL
ncbi:MAG: histidine kinase, dimerization and phosphoacceptor region [Actinobacteria bacterium]|nr:histidine kinase, dimerization and phosphoacceptor region [Actinomycetota bacterium]